MRQMAIRAGAFDGIWAAASLIHLQKSEVRSVLRELNALVKRGGILAATLAYGRRSGYLQKGWIPGRFISRWQRLELERAVRQAGWELLSLKTVANRERKGRWLNLLARRPIVVKKSL